MTKNRNFLQIFLSRIVVVATSALPFLFASCSVSESDHSLESANHAVSHPTNPTLGISGDRFTINGSPTFLLGVSYYDANFSHLSDLDRLQDNGFNLIRVFLAMGSRHSEEHFFFNGDGDWKVGAEDRLLDLVGAAADRGLVVDVAVLNSHDGASDIPYEVLDKAVRNAARALGHKSNVIYDLMNEHNRYNSASHSRMARLVAAAREEDPDGIFTYSSYEGSDFNTSSEYEVLEEEIDSGIDVFSPHLPRWASWADETQNRAERIRAHMASIGQVVPLYLQEEHRRGFNSVEPSKLDFLTALRGALAGGAAGWVFHTDAAFDLDQASFFESLDSVEADTIDELADVVFGGGPTPRCEEQYGNVTGVQFCSSTDTSCTFRALLNGTMSCRDVCTANGGSCLAQYGNGAACHQTRAESCDDVGSMDDICVCTLEGPGPEPLSQCEERYGGVAGIQLCSSTDTSCTFRALLNRTMSCEDVCTANGGSCITQYGNGAACEQTREESCGDVGSMDDICVCTLEAVSDCHGERELGDFGYCTPSCSCGRGEGDCNGSADCRSGLRCVRNVGASYGWNADVDVCE